MTKKVTLSKEAYSRLIQAAMDMKVLVNSMVAFLEETADQLDKWAESSESGGWSTHQVDGNRRLADQCRRMAATAKRQIR